MKTSAIRNLFTLGSAVALAASLVHCNNRPPMQGTPDLGSAQQDLAAPPDMRLPAPTITAISPAVGQNAAPTQITITGTAFQDGATVTVGEQPCLSPAVTPTRITCTVPVNPRICGVKPVVVSNPDHQSATSTTGFTGFSASFQVGAPLPSAIYPYVSPLILVSGDFNGDGILDIATGDVSPARVSVLLGHGDGTFQDAVDYAAGPALAGLAVGDLNGDGKPDLVATSGTSKSYSVLLGHGDGTFQTAATTATAFSAVSVAVADLNGDHQPDLVMAAIFVPSGDGYAVLPGNGDGTFQDASFTASLDYQVGPVLGDFNRDGTPDLLFTGYWLGGSTGGVSVALGNGDGTFGARIASGRGTQYNQVIAADFNSDGKLDVAVTPVNNTFTASVSVMLGNGDGTFQLAVPVKGLSPIPRDLSAADLNGDGIQDLVTIGYVSGVPSSTGFSYLQGQGDGTFAAPVTTAAYNSGHVLLGDLNGDHLPDVTVLNGSQVVAFLRQCP